MEAPCRALLATGVFFWLSGCAVGPDYRPHLVAMPTEFRTSPLTPAVAGPQPTADLVRWWQVLHDPTLDALIERAVASNPDVEIMLTRVHEARTQEIVVLGAMLPDLRGSGTVATGSGLDLSIGRVSEALRSGDQLANGVHLFRIGGFDTGWELDLFGKYQRSLEAARDDTSAQMELRSAVLITVIADVAREYFEIRGRQMQGDIVRRNVAMAQRAVDLLEARASGHEQAKSSEPSGHDEESKSSSTDHEQPKSSESAGHDDRSTAADRRLSKELDLASAKRELATWQAKLPELDAAIFAAQSRLAVLLGTYSADVTEAARGPTKMPRLPERLRPGVPVDLLRRRPDIRAVERELAEATARIGVATADLFPSVTLLAAVGGQAAEQLAGAPPIPLHGPVWSVGPATYWPLLDFGRLDALINIREMRAHGELVKYKKTVIAAVEEVERAISQYRLDLRRSRRLGIALQESRREVDLATELFERKQTEGHVMLSARHKYYTLAEETAIAAEVAVFHYVGVFKALGGGWELYNELPPIPAPQPAIVAGVRRLTNGWH